MISLRKLHGSFQMLAHLRQEFSLHGFFCSVDVNPKRWKCTSSEIGENSMPWRIGDICLWKNMEVGKLTSSWGLCLEILKAWGKLIIADHTGEYWWRGKERYATGWKWIPWNSGCGHCDLGSWKNPPGAPQNSHWGELGTAKRMTEKRRWEQKKWIIQVHEKETAQKKRKRSQGGAPEACGGKREW